MEDSSAPISIAKRPSRPLEYAGPFAPPVASRLGVWRQGKTLVLFNGSALPPRCIGCGAADLTSPLVLRLSWLPLWMRFFGEFLFIVLGFARHTRMEVSLCAVCHRRRGQILKWAGISLAAGAIMLLFALDTLAQEPAAFSALLFLTAAFFLRRARPVTVRRMAHGVVYVRGAAPGYLAELPIGGPPGIGMIPDDLANRLQHVRNARRRRRKHKRARKRTRHGDPPQAPETTTTSSPEPTSFPARDIPVTLPAHP